MLTCHRWVLLLCSLGIGAMAFAGDNQQGDLPKYVPEITVDGVLRSRGNDHMAKLLKCWQGGFRKYHPDVRFDDSLNGSASGMYGIDMRTADFALMGRPLHPYERYGVYERSWVFPVEIEVATGSHARAHKSPAYAILVHRDNPLSRISVAQLDSVFGAQRSGGWDALSWVEQAKRGPEANIRTWSQLGVQGELADKAIHVYGPPLQGAGVVTPFQSLVFQGGAMWNEDLREYPDRRQMISDLASDPQGIAYIALSYAHGDVKPLAVGETASGPFVELTEDNVASRNYPLARPVYLVFAIDNEQAEFSNPRGDPRVKEFLRYILSREGQQDVARDGTYLPLPPDTVQAQRRKIDATETPPERILLTR